MVPDASDGNSICHSWTIALNQFKNTYNTKYVKVSSRQSNESEHQPDECVLRA
jgi:hypothetical protein